LRSPATKAIAAAIVASWRNQAAKVLLEADARFLRDTGGIGIEGPKKTPDLPLHLFVARWGDLTWLDVALHFRLHPYPSPEKRSLASKEAATRTVSLNTYVTAKFLFGGET